MTPDGKLKSVEEMRKALRPFADAAAKYDPPEDDDNWLCWDANNWLQIGWLRRARAALSPPSASEPTTFAWLIERNGTYLTDAGFWTADPWRAARFPSRERAETSRLSISLTAFRDEARAVEHGFLPSAGVEHETLS